MTEGDGSASDGCQPGKRAVNAHPDPLGPMQGSNQQNHSGGDHANALEDTQRAGLKAVHVLQIKGTGHGGNTGQQGKQVELTGCGDQGQHGPLFSSGTGEG